MFAIISRRLSDSDRLQVSRVARIIQPAGAITASAFWFDPMLVRFFP